ncbi:MAG: hypothetical protein M0R32_05780 [Candidatus Cloacimonetes bacterium]|nr:hypothetical protein [Candidatus Cloacimonadota bacterium]
MKGNTMKQTLREELAQKLALIYAEQANKKLARKYAVLKRRLHKASLVQPHKRPAGGKQHLVALVEALRKHTILPHKRLIAEAIRRGAASSCRNPEWPIHAILCRHPLIFTRPARGHWMLAKGWEKPYAKLVA